jgi:hypothetical protein
MDGVSREALDRAREELETRREEVTTQLKDVEAELKAVCARIKAFEMDEDFDKIFGAHGDGDGDGDGIRVWLGSLPAAREAEGIAKAYKRGTVGFSMQCEHKFDTETGEVDFGTITPLYVTSIWFDKAAKKSLTEEEMDAIDCVLCEESMLEDFLEEEGKEAYNCEDNVFTVGRLPFFLVRSCVV